MTDFRLCLTCLSYSQASICHYTQKLVMSSLNLPLWVSVTFLETTAPVKLTVLNCHQLINLVLHYNKSDLSLLSLQLTNVKTYQRLSLITTRVTSKNSLKLQLRFMGSFRLTTIIAYLHAKSNFTEFIFETVGKSLCLSCRSTIN